MRWIDNREWRWLVSSAAKSGADSERWLARHSALKVVDQTDTGRGVKLALQAADGSERSVLCDQNENVLAVLP